MIYGIKYLTILPVSSNPSPTSINHLPLRADGKLTITDEPVKDYLERTLPNWINFKAEGESYYNDLLSLNLAHTLAQNKGAMCEIVPEGNQGVFRFAENHYLGYDYEFLISKDSTTIKHTLEGKFEHAVGKWLIQTAINNSRLWSANQSLQMAHYKNNKITNFSGLDGNFIKDFNMKIATKGEKTINNKVIPSVYDVSLEITTYDSNAIKIKEAFDLTGGATINISNGLAIVIANNTLYPTREIIIGSKDKSLKITWAGQVPISALTINLTENWVLISNQ